MLSKRSIKIIAVISLILMLVLTVSSVVFAGDITKVPDPKSSPVISKVQDSSGILLGIFQAVGTAVSVIVLVYIGVKYVLASPEGKADVKKQAYVYVLGAALIFGATWILPLIIDMIGKMNTTTPT